MYSCMMEWGSELSSSRRLEWVTLTLDTFTISLRKSCYLLPPIHVFNNAATQMVVELTTPPPQSLLIGLIFPLPPPVAAAAGMVNKICRAFYFGFPLLRKKMLLLEALLLLYYARVQCRSKCLPFQVLSRFCSDFGTKRGQLLGALLGACVCLPKIMFFLSRRLHEQASRGPLFTSASLDSADCTD